MLSRTLRISNLKFRVSLSAGVCVDTTSIVSVSNSGAVPTSRVPYIISSSGIVSNGISNTSTSSASGIVVSLVNVVSIVISGCGQFYTTRVNGVRPRLSP